MSDSTALAGNPVVGKSWEGFVIESLLAVAPDHAKSSFYATVAGAEVDLVLELGGNQGTWAIEVKRSLSAKPERGFYQAIEDIQPTKAFVVYAGSDQYPISQSVQAIGLRSLAELILGCSAPEILSA